MNRNGAAQALYHVVPHNHDTVEAKLGSLQRDVATIYHIEQNLERSVGALQKTVQANKDDVRNVAKNVAQEEIRDLANAVGVVKDSYGLWEKKKTREEAGLIPKDETDNEKRWTFDETPQLASKQPHYQNNTKPSLPNYEFWGVYKDKDGKQFAYA